MSKKKLDWYERKTNQTNNKQIERANGFTGGKSKMGMVKQQAFRLKVGGRCQKGFEKGP